MHGTIDISNLPIYEPGLDTLISRSRNKNLFLQPILRNLLQKQIYIFYQLIPLQKQKGLELEKLVT